MNSVVKGENIWRDEYLLHSFHVDINQKAFPSSIFNFMLASAWAHANHSDFSYDILKDDGAFWVLSRFYAEFDNLPSWNERLIIETWGKGVDRLFALRDYYLLSAEGSKIGGASSAWLILDKQTLKPHRPEKLKTYFKFNTQVNAVQCSFDKLKGPDAETYSANYTIRYSDIDLNRHASSANYLKWIIDTLPIEFTCARQIKTFEINYTAEGHLGDELLISIHEDVDSHNCKIKRISDGITLCRAHLTWH